MTDRNKNCNIAKFQNKKLITPILSFVVMATLMLAVYMFKGIYPFGTKHIAYYDLAHSYIPGYYHTYDVFHGEDSVFWSWYSGGGISVYDIFGNYILHPFNLFFLFVKRNKILESMSIFLLIKVCFSAFAMSFYCQRKYEKTNTNWQILCGVLYASQSYFIQYYTNIYFFDLIASFPIIMYGVDSIIERKKIKLYSIFMALGFITNLQIMGMVCFFIIIYSGIMLWKRERKEQHEAIGLIGVGTLVAMLLSAIVWLPTYLSVKSSARANEIVGITDNILYDLNMPYYLHEKLFMLYGTEIVIAVLIYCFIYHKDKVKQNKKLLLINFLLIIPIFFELVNIAWHIGGYVQFPLRFGFIIGFSMLLLANELYPCWCERKERKKSAMHNIIACLLAVVIFVILYIFVTPFQKFGIRDVYPFKAYPLVLVGLVIAYVGILWLKRKNSVLYIIILLQCWLGWYGFLGPAYFDVPEHDPSFIGISEYVKEHVLSNAEENPRESRIKDESTLLNTGYPFIIQNGSMSNWTMGTNANLIELMKKLGYTRFNVRIMDTGGSLFTDAFFHIEKIVTFDRKVDRFHSISEEMGSLILKQNQLIYPFGIVVDSDLSVFQVEIENDAISYQNEIFKYIHGSERDLFTVYDVQNLLDEENSDISQGRYEFRIPINGERELYIQPVQNNYYTFSVNGEYVAVPTIENGGNVVFPAYFNNGLLDCGLYKDEVVQVSVSVEWPLDFSELKIAGLDTELLEEKVQQQMQYRRDIQFRKNGLKMDITSMEGGKLLLPVGYKDGIELQVNGKSINCEKAMGDTLMLIPLEKGDNKIVFRYIPEGFKVGCMLSLLGIIGVLNINVIACFISKNKVLSNISYYVFMLIFFGIMVCVYLIPIILNLILKIWWFIGNQEQITHFFVR